MVQKEFCLLTKLYKVNYTKDVRANMVVSDKDIIGTPIPVNEYIRDRKGIDTTLIIVDIEFHVPVFKVDNSENSKSNYFSFYQGSIYSLSTNTERETAFRQNENFANDGKRYHSRGMSNYHIFWQEYGDETEITVEYEGKKSILDMRIRGQNWEIQNYELGEEQIKIREKHIINWILNSYYESEGGYVTDTPLIKMFYIGEEIYSISVCQKEWVLMSNRYIDFGSYIGEVLVEYDDYIICKVKPTETFVKEMFGKEMLEHHKEFIEENLTIDYDIYEGFYFLDNQGNETTKWNKETCVAIMIENVTTMKIDVSEIPQFTLHESGKYYYFTLQDFDLNLIYKKIKMTKEQYLQFKYLNDIYYPFPKNCKDQKLIEQYTYSQKS